MFAKCHFGSSLISLEVVQYKGGYFRLLQIQTFHFHNYMTSEGLQIFSGTSSPLTPSHSKEVFLLMSRLVLIFEYYLQDATSHKINLAEYGDTLITTKQWNRQV